MQQMFYRVAHDGLDASNVVCQIIELYNNNGLFSPSKRNNVQQLLALEHHSYIYLSSKPFTLSMALDSRVLASTLFLAVRCVWQRVPLPFGAISIQPSSTQRRPQSYDSAQSAFLFEDESSQDYWK